MDAWLHLAEALREPELSAQVRAAGEALVSSLAAGGKVLVAGNGGSAAIASHVAAEFIGKCIHDRAPLPAVNLAESLSSITAIGNDYGYEHVFDRGVRALARPGDVYLAMSTSGRSANIVQSVATAREMGVTTIAMTGLGGEHLRDAVDHLLVVPSVETPRIQEVHMLWAHAWCEAVDVLSQRS
ncbi:phosphoheptose isomerase [Dermacoccus sp. PE3]|nr:phosphoheptose isomerase [Dermacoccus sp. PE3]